MKITESTKNNVNNNNSAIRDDKRVSDSNGESFDVRLKRIASDNHQEIIEKLLGKIEAQAEKLKKKVDIREIMVYKKMISEFLDEAVTNSHKFSKESKLDRRGRHRVYSVVKKINQKLEELTQQTLSDEKDNIAIVQSLDDIRGLLFDIST